MRNHGLKQRLLETVPPLIGRLEDHAFLLDPRTLADEELQKRMRENCYKAAERYDLECIGQEWLALFGKL